MMLPKHNKVKYKSFLAYLSTSLNLSFLIIYKLFLIIIGIIIALCSIDKEKMCKSLKIEKSKKEIIDKIKQITKENSFKIKEKIMLEKTNIAIIQAVYELGFITSLNYINYMRAYNL